MGPYPFAEGTSSTVENYRANSSNNFAPANAAIFDILNGDGNWWVSDYATLPTPLSSSKALIVNNNIQVVASDDCAIQLVPFVSIDGFPDVITVDTQLLYTRLLLGNSPITIDTESSYISNLDMLGGGILMRLLTSNVAVVIVRGTLELNEGLQ